LIAAVQRFGGNQGKSGLSLDIAEPTLLTHSRLSGVSAYEPEIGAG
jgi:hypothetical protein